MATMDLQDHGEFHRIDDVTTWEYARLEYRATGDYGTDSYMDWRATFHSGQGKVSWGIDDRYNDIAHLNRAGAEGWQAYDRTAAFFHGEPHRLQAVTYSFRRELTE